MNHRVYPKEIWEKAVMDLVKLKKGDYVRVKYSYKKDEDGLVVRVMADRADVWLIRGWSGDEAASRVKTFDVKDLVMEPSFPESFARVLSHEVRMSQIDQGRAERGVKEAVESLFKAQLAVEKIKEEIKLLQDVCQHDAEVTGTSPMGSFTATYYKCRTCGKEWNDD